MFLVAATFELMIGNYMKYGFLVDFSLLNCLVSDFSFSLAWYLAILMQCFVVYFAWNNYARNVVSWNKAVLVTIAILAAINFGTIAVIILRRIAVIMATLLAGTAAVFAMKLYSFAMVVHEIKREERHVRAKLSPGAKVVIPDLTIIHFSYFLAAPTVCCLEIKKNKNQKENI